MDSGLKKETETNIKSEDIFIYIKTVFFKIGCSMYIK